MKTPQCEREQETLDALRSGRLAGPWGEETRRHAAGCPLCSEVVFVAEALRQDGVLAEAQARLPGAGLMWWKAQLAARRAAADRALQPIALAEKVAYVCGTLTVAAGLVWRWPELRTWLHRLGVDWAHTFPQWILRSNSLLVVSLTASFAAFLLLTMFALLPRLGRRLAFLFSPHLRRPNCQP